MLLLSRGNERDVHETNRRQDGQEAGIFLYLPHGYLSVICFCSSVEYDAHVFR